MIAFTALVQRELVRFYRQRSRVVGALLTPILFWLFIGAGIGNSFHADGGGGFLEYFFPGTLVLIVFFTAIFSTISIIEDRREGFLQSVLVSPVSRLTMVSGKIAGGALLAVLQAAIFLALAPFAGISPGAASVVLVLLTLALVALGLTGLGFVIAWHMDSTQGFHAIMNVFLIPLWLLSGAAFPAASAHGWIRAAMAVNPVSYGVAAVRRALYSSDPARALDGVPSFVASVIVTALFAALMIGLSAWAAERRVPISQG
jgi:ABC-2 type transport system permease protein